MGLDLDDQEGAIRVDLFQIGAWVLRVRLVGWRLTRFTRLFGGSRFDANVIALDDAIVGENHDGFARSSAVQHAQAIPVNVNAAAAAHLDGVQEGDDLIVSDRYLAEDLAARLCELKGDAAQVRDGKVLNGDAR